MSAPPNAPSSSAIAPRPPTYSASMLFQGNSSFGFQGIYPAFQSAEQEARREQELKKRRVSDSRRQRTPMSCDRCKLRKIKVKNSSILSIDAKIYFFSVSIQILGHVTTVRV